MYILDTIICIFAQQFYIENIFFSWEGYYNLERLESSNWCYHLASLFFLQLELSFRCSCFHNLDKFDQSWLCFVSYDVMRFTEIWCDEWDFELHWAKLNIRLRWKSPLKVFVFSLQVWSFVSNVHWFLWWQPIILTWKKLYLPLWIILIYPWLPRTDSTNDQETTQSSIKNYIRNQVGISEGYPIAKHTYHII